MYCLGFSQILLQSICLSQIQCVALLTANITCRSIFQNQLLAAKNAALKAPPAIEKKETKVPDMVAVKSNFDPTAIPTSTANQNPLASQKPPGAPKPAPKESVVFEATTAQIQELVLESPVPVLLDVYADWYVPCVGQVV